MTKRLMLRLENGSRPLFWGSLPGGLDGWGGEIDRAYFWSEDTPVDEAVSNGLPVVVDDLHGRPHAICVSFPAIVEEVTYRRDRQGDEPSDVRLVEVEGYGG